MTDLASEPQVKDPSAGRAFDGADAVFRRDPYPRYAELRESPTLQLTSDGLYVLTRHADVLAAVRDPRLSSNPRHRAGAAGRRGVGRLASSGDGPTSMLMSDPPDHTRLRRLANRAFTPRAVEALRPRVTQLVDDLLDQASKEETGDLMTALAEPLPVMVICDLLGVPSADWDRFKPWSTAITRTLDGDVPDEVVEQARPAVEGFVVYFAELMAQRRADPRDDLLSALIAAEAEGDKLSEGELFSMIILLFVAGHETTTNLIGNGTLALMRHRDQFDALRADPGLAPAATEELLRYDSPVQVTGRTATEAVEIAGIPLEPGEGVVCGLAAANRDPRWIERPDELILARGAGDHLSFSHGMHHCLGAPLARLEGQVVFGRLSQRFPHMELSDSDPPYRDHFVLRGLASLPIRWGAG